MTRDVLAHALITGVPVKQIGWVCECGESLKENYKCDREYILEDGELKEK